jgi:UDP-N-acetylmuramoyl-tripeptide--D-alanyl-D-alanine ligase
MVGKRLEWTAGTVRRVSKGEWLQRPSSGWRAEGFAISRDDFRPRRMVIAASEAGQFGVDLNDIPKLPHVAGVVVDAKIKGVKNLPEALPVLQVQDTKAALIDLAKHVRDSFPGRIFAVTGSAGKTSTCDMLRTALSRYGVTARKTDVNTSLLACARFLTQNLTKDFLVIEMALGGLARMAPLARPHCAIVTSIAEAHLEHFDSLRTLALGKAQIFDGSFPGTIGVLNRDMPYWDDIAAFAVDKGARVFSFGMHAEADTRLLAYESEGRRVQAVVFGQPITYNLSIPGRHMAMNSLAVVTAIVASGLDSSSALEALGEKHVVRQGRVMHQQLRIHGRRILLIDDAYNANPLSMRSGLDLLGDTRPSGQGRRIAVLGEMLELRPDAPRLHAELAEAVLRNRVDRVFVAGPLMEHLWNALPAEIRGVHTDDAGALPDILRTTFRHGDVVLVKGSHSSRMHEITDMIRLWAAPKAATAPAGFDSA